jgi:membrane protein DedA with SNARE-associated domain
MVENILNQISTFPPVWIYLTLFLFAFVENVFPPSPSDVVIVIGGSLIASGGINFPIALGISTLGSITGFMLMFYIGSTVDKKVIHSGKFKFIPIDAIDKVEAWFRKYGYMVIIANRFMPGTRAVISFFAGISNLDPKKTITLCFISALLWNAIMLSLGFMFGDNVQKVDEYLNTYSNIVIVITVAVILFFVIRFFIRKKKEIV